MGDKTDSSDPSKINYPKPTDFDKFLPWACHQFCVVNNIVVTRDTHEPYITGATKKQMSYIRKPLPMSSPALVDHGADADGTSYSSSYRGDLMNNENSIKVTTFYDSNGKLVQVKFLNNKAIPRMVMQTVALTIPYQKHLTSITINSGLCMDSLYEISKFLPDSQITELCLDSTFVSEANYHTLLTHGKLKHLSLAKCSIDDAIVKTIADQLEHPRPASRVLSALNLSMNRITDIGAKYFADVLRANRQLSYLNLAGNMITDKGGMSILDTLQKFPLLHEELLASRARYVTYLRERNDLINTFITELQTANSDKNYKKKMKKTKMEAQSLQNVGAEKRNTESANDAQLIKEKAEYMAETRMGVFEEAFSLNNTRTRDGVVYCFGNNTMCYLNLAYNNLTYASVKKLLEVLSNQKSLNRTPRGLIKVVIDGNLMPVACKEYQDINLLLGSGLMKKSDIAMKGMMRKCKIVKTLGRRPEHVPRELGQGGAINGFL